MMQYHLLSFWGVRKPSLWGLHFVFHGIQLVFLSIQSLILGSSFWRNLRSCIKFELLSSPSPLIAMPCLAKYLKFDSAFSKHCRLSRFSEATWFDSCSPISLHCSGSVTIASMELLWQSDPSGVLFICHYRIFPIAVAPTYRKSRFTFAPLHFIPR